MLENITEILEKMAMQKRIEKFIEKIEEKQERNKEDLLVRILSEFEEKLPYNNKISIKFYYFEEFSNMYEIISNALNHNCPEKYEFIVEVIPAKDPTTNTHSDGTINVLLQKKL